MRIPALEGLFPTPWTAGARRVLPSPSPQLTATAMWGPVLSWCIIELLAESIEPESPERTAMDLFDRLRLRQPLGNAFAALGFEGEENWRVAARIKVALLIGAGVAAEGDSVSNVALGDLHKLRAGQDATSVPATSTAAGNDAAAPKELPLDSEAKPILSPALWQDPDVRWLTGAHEAEGHTYFLQESYEDLLWWLQLPVLCRLATSRLTDRKAFADMSKSVAIELDAAAAAGYRLDALLKHEDPEDEAKPEAYADAELVNTADPVDVGKTKAEPAGENEAAVESHTEETATSAKDL
jgi:hypothetical protein